MNKREDLPVRDALVAASLHEVTERGLAGFSLRSVAAMADRSTTAVFQHFGNKTGLLLAAIEQAIVRERALQERLASDLAGLPFDLETVADLIALVIERRARCNDPAIRIWPELLFNSSLFPEASALMGSWHETQVVFWADLLGAAHRSKAPVIAAYAAMEEAYATVLHNEPAYALLIRETARHLVGAGPAAVPEGIVTSWLATRTSPPPPPAASDDAVLRDRLLDVAAQEVFDHGVSALSHRKLTAKVGASPAMIVYHFGDMATLTREAIWKALFANLPSYLHDQEPVVAPRLTTDGWATSLALTVRPDSSHGPKGFYVNYSRIVGQICLRARHDPGLAPIVRYLRTIEGSGIHHASRTAWPADLALSRARATGFAIWIKGFATLNEALARTDIALIDRGLGEAREVFQHS